MTRLRALAIRIGSFRWIVLILLLLWTATLAVSVSINAVLERRSVIELSQVEARAAYNKDLVYRRWASLHGGVYVPITPDTPPNPYLNVPERDIQTPGGRPLTLINPAYMTRQVYELSAAQSGVYGHITSLKPIRPENAPDAWEAAALVSFENGVTEVSEVVTMQDAPYLRLMRPMIAEESCLKCHATQGYKVGDVRGGISVAVPLAPYYTIMNDRILRLVGGGGVIWLLGIVAIAIVGLFAGRRRAAYDQVTAALRSSEEKFSKAFQGAPLLMKITSLEDGTCLEVNEKFLQISGFTRAEVIGHTVVDLGWLSARDRAYLVELIHTQGRVTDLELSPHTKDGRELICLYQGELLNIGGQQRLLSIALDITERKQVERTLYFLAQRSWVKHDADFFKSLALYLGETLHVDYVHIDQVGPDSKSARTLASYWLGDIQPDYAYSLLDTPCENTYGRELCTYAENVQQFFPRDLSLIDMQAESYCGVSLCDSRGNPVGLIAVLHRKSLTNARQVESLLQLVAVHAGHEIERQRAELVLRHERDLAQHYLDTVEAVIVALDLEGRITLLNRKGCRLLGYTESELIGLSWFEICLPPSDESIKARVYFEQLIGGRDNPVEYYENPVVTRSGEQRQIAWHNTVLYDQQGHVSGTLSAGEDITERKRLEEQIRQQERLAAVGQLAAGVAHDFNNFLTTSMLYAQLGLRNPDRPVNVTRSLETILNESRKAAKLVQQIMDFSRRSTIEFTTTDLRPLLENVVGVLSHTLPENIDLHLQVAPDAAGYTVKVDPTRFQQIVANLATNGRDAMPDGGDLRIALDRAHVSDDSPVVGTIPAGNWIRLAVSDTGTGIAPQVLDHIFEPFFTTKPPGKGTGLGLPQVHGIVAQHGGHIQVETAPTRGTTFYIYFPEAHGTGPVTTPLTERMDNRGRREKILLVEDRDELRAAAHDLLENQGYQVIAAANGREALRLSQAEDHIDLLITDLVMPEMGGRELMRALRTVLPNLKALAITGYLIPEEERALHADGFVDVIYKPFDVNNLTYVVRRVLDMHYN